METIEQLSIALAEYSTRERNLPGIENSLARTTFATQIVASVRRIEYIEKIRNRDVRPERIDPCSSHFDPERAAILHAREGRLDEAFWLIFLSTHFGKHSKHGWRRLKDVYSGLGTGIWDWERTSSDPAGFRIWLRDNGHRIGGSFGNHRKYESLRDDSSKGTAAVVESYLAWIGPSRSHSERVAELVRRGGNDPHMIFDEFYNSMNVLRFGRLGKFDFLALVGRLDLAPIAPGSTYLKGATGPLKGARLLFCGDRYAQAQENTLEEWVSDLGLGLNVGMQVMEDSLCNWQKSPTSFVHFRG